MKKEDAIKALGGSVTEAAAAIGVSTAAISQWPKELPQRIVDRVQAAQWRIAQGMPHPKSAHAVVGEPAKEGA